MEFKIEKYYAENGKSNSLVSNQPTSDERDSWLENLAKEMVSDLEYETGIRGTLSPVLSAQKRSLTHWRVLSFDCAGKRLSIYPDGGFMNEWMIYNAPGDYKYYDISTITHDTEISIYRNQDIKFDVTIEDIQK